MINQALFESVSEQLAQFVAGKGAGDPEQVRQEINAMLRGTFNRLDLVSREEFDAQKAVLLRTREKVELLEKQLQQIEESLNRPSSDNDR